MRSTLGDRKTGARTGFERGLLVVVVLLQLAIAAQLIVVSRRQGNIEEKLTAVQASTLDATDRTDRTALAQNSRRLQRLPRPALTPLSDPRSALFEAQRAFDDMDALFAQVFTDFERLEESFNMDDHWRSLMVSPTLDMRESADAYSVYFSLPELDPRNVQVTLDGRILTIQAAYAHPAYTRRHGRPCSLEKRVQLPGPVGHANQSSAIWTNGALRISVPKARETLHIPASLRLF